MCFVICLGHTTQVQQREIILVFLKTLPSQYLSLAADPITLIMGCLEGSGEMSRAGTLDLAVLAAELLEGELEISVRTGTGGCCPWEGLPHEQGCQEGATAFPERKIKPPCLNGTTVPRSPCQPGEVLLAAQAVQLCNKKYHYFRL